MSDEQLNQTSFSNDQTRFQPVGLPPVAKTNVAVDEKKPEVTKPNTILLGAFAVLFVIVLGGIFYYLSQHGSSGGQSAVQATPTPFGTPVLSGELLEKITPLLKEAEIGDPDTHTLPAPPIDYSLRLQDAATVKQ